MSQYSQTLKGWFKRSSINTALCNLHLLSNLNKVFNVIENIQGAKGITIRKPLVGDGLGWTIEAEENLTSPTSDTNKVLPEDSSWGKSIEYVPVSGTDENGLDYDRYFQLRNFEIGADGAILTADDTNWTDTTIGQDSEKILVRKTTAENKYELQYKSHNPMPDGDSTNTVAVWDDTVDGWKKAAAVNLDDDATELNIGGGKVVTSVALSTTAGKMLDVKTQPLGPKGDATNVAIKWDNDAAKYTSALPIAALNDEQSTAVVKNDRVVTGAKIGPSGALIQLVTQPLGEMGGGIPPGYADGTVIVAQQWDSSTKKIQIKTATGLIKTGTVSAWTDSITFAQFND